MFLNNKKFYPSLIFLVVITLTRHITPLICQDNNIRFDHITIDEGLSQNAVYCILQDSKGFMWFGTQEGLNRFDGRTFEIYKTSDDSLTLSSSFIYDICEDQLGNIWVGTKKGLNRFDRIKETFHEIALSDSLPDNWILSLHADEKGNIWVGTTKGLAIIDAKNYKWIKNIKTIRNEVTSICGRNNNYIFIGAEDGLFQLDIKYTENNPIQYMTESIWNIFKDIDRQIWVSTSEGNLFRYDSDKDKFNHIVKYDVGIKAICKDINNNLWLGLDGAGIKISKNGQTLIELTAKSYDKRSISNNFVETIVTDKKGTIWLGTYGGGVNKYDSKKEKFITYYNDPKDDNSLSENMIFSVFEDHERSFWIGTLSGHINKFNTKLKKFTQIKLDLFKYNTISSVFEDSKGRLWIGTGKGTLFQFADRVNLNIQKIENNSFGKRRIRAIREDHDKKHLWIATEDRGILFFDPDSNKIISYMQNEGLNSNNVYSIFPDDTEHNFIWVGTDRGNIHKFDKRLNRLNEIESGTSLDIKIYSIINDPLNPKNLLWLGTNKGLHAFDKNQKNIAYSYTIENGLPNNVVYGILPDSKGNLWVSTNDGLSKYNSIEKKIERNFDFRDGLQSKEFNRGAYFKSRFTGKMYFGGIEGLSVFHPDSIINDQTVPSIQFVNLAVNNQNITVDDTIKGSDFVLESSISETDYLEFAQNDFVTFRFASLDYSIPEKIEYYKLLVNEKGDTITQNYDKDNYYTHNQLKNGIYTLKVWGSNSDGYLNKSAAHASINFKILLPWYKNTTVQLTIIIIVLVIGFGLVFHWGKAPQTRRAKQKTKVAEWKRREAEKHALVLEQLNKIIAHISAQENINNVSDAIIENIINFFGFDYSAISIVNHLEKTISTYIGKTKIPELVNPNNWKHLSEYYLDDKDILAEYARKDRRGITRFYGPDVDLDKEKSLNKEICVKYHHEKLDRIFIPIEYIPIGPLKDENTENVIGVIEAGYHIESSTYKKKNIPTAGLELFISSCAHILNRELNQERIRIVDKIIETCSKIDEHNEYLKQILKESTNVVEGDKGIIIFATSNDEEVSFNTNPIYYNFKNNNGDLTEHKDKLKTQIFILRHVADTKSFYYSGDIKNDALIKDFDNINSELVVPMIHSNKVIGVLAIYSKKNNFFNDSKAFIVQNIADKASDIFPKKKLNQIISNLVVPLELFTDLDKIYKLIIDTIRDYFITEYVSLWEKTNDDKLNYALISASSSLSVKYKKINLSSLKNDILHGNDRNLRLINFKNSQNHEDEFGDFAQQNEFKSMILVPFFIGQLNFGFINIFFKENILNLFTEDETFLKQIAIKGAITSQYRKLINSFMDISESFTSDHLNDIFETLTINASKVLHADPVVLFRYEPERNIFMATITGNLYHPKLKGIINQEDKRIDHLTKYIAEKGSVWFEKSSDYHDYTSKIQRLKRGRHFEQDFWTREKIESLVAIQLKYDEIPLGAMFFNYRTPQKFNDDIKRLHEAFALLASQAIVNAKRLEKRDDFLKTKMLFSKSMTESEIASSVAHNSGNLLTAINLKFNRFINDLKFSKKLKGVDVKKEIVTNFFDEMKYPLTRLMYSFDMLAKYRKTDELIEEYRVKDLIEDSLSLTKEMLSKLDIKVKLDFKCNPTVVCDNNQMNHVLLNLIFNSRDSIKGLNRKNGLISIKVEYKDAKKEEVVIQIADNGSGISKDNHNRIFDTYFTTKEKEGGTGLGLPISRFIVERHGGRIDFRSSDKKWTTFEMVLQIEKENGSK